MSDLPDSELLRVQQQLRLQASQDRTDPEYFENISNRIGKILKGQSEVPTYSAPTYSAPGMVRSLNYEGRHITQVMKRFEDAPIGFRVLLSSVENNDKRYYHLLVKESEKHWIRVDENGQVVWDASHPISMVNFGEVRIRSIWSLLDEEFVPLAPKGAPQVAPQESVGQVKIASTWAISGKE